MSPPLEILFASDFSARAATPLERARRVAGALGAKLAILHVVAERDLSSPAQADDLARRLRAALPAALSTAELVIVAGSAPEAIAATAQARASALIVTGAGRRNSLGDYLLGDAVQHIVRAASTPVLVARDAPAADYAKLVVATDYSDCSAAALLAAAKLFPAARIVAVHAARVPYADWISSPESQSVVLAEAQTAMDAFVAGQRFAHVRDRLEGVVEHGALEEVVIRRIDAIGADLLALGSHGHSGFFHATIGGDAEALLGASPVDTLMVRA